jgi:cholesterol transport system auxiliary component
MTLRWLFPLLLSGCALTSKAPPLDIHYYSPAPEGARDDGAASRQPSSHASAPPIIELGRITSSGSLRARIAHRESAVELGLYETRRWTDDPDVYVRRALEHHLFDRGAFGHAVDGRHPMLDLEVIAFEEARTARGRGERAGRITLRYQLHDEHTVFADGIVDVERTATGDGFEAVVVAIRDALDEAADRLVAVVGRALAADPANASH